MTLGEYLLKIREDRGLSLRAVSEKSGISIAEISRLENGKRLRPSPEALKALAKALVVDYSDLMKLAGFSEEVYEEGKTFEKVFKNLETGEIVDVVRGVKDMFRTDENWANVAFRVSSNLDSEARATLTGMVESYLASQWKKTSEQKADKTDGK